MKRDGSILSLYIVILIGLSFPLTSLPQQEVKVKGIDFQFIRKNNQVREIRSLLEENGKKKSERDASLKIKMRGQSQEKFRADNYNRILSQEFQELIFQRLIEIEILSKPPHSHFIL